MGGLVSVIVAILAAVTFYGTGHPFLFWSCVILSIASLWIWGIMHNFAMDSAKAKRDNLLEYMVREGRSPKEIERLETSPIRVSGSDINTVPNWLSWMSMAVTAISLVLLIVRIGDYFTQKPGAKLKQPPIAMEEKAPMPMPAPAPEEKAPEPAPAIILYTPPPWAGDASPGTPSYPQKRFNNRQELSNQSATGNLQNAITEEQLSRGSSRGNSVDLERAVSFGKQANEYRRAAIDQHKTDPGRAARLSRLADQYEQKAYEYQRRYDKAEAGIQERPSRTNINPEIISSPPEIIQTPPPNMIDARTGTLYLNTGGGGYINSRTGAYVIDAGGGIIDTQTGKFHPK